MLELGMSQYNMETPMLDFGGVELSQSLYAVIENTLI
jgi:hypothetical protein